MKALMWAKILAVVLGLSILGLVAAVAQENPPTVNTEQLMCAEKAAGIKSLEDAQFKAIFLGEVKGNPVVGMLKPATEEEDGFFIILGLRNNESKILVCTLLSLKVYHAQ